jgi:hypothetical protein
MALNSAPAVLETVGLPVPDLFARCASPAIVVYRGTNLSGIKTPLDIFYSI